MIFYKYMTFREDFFKNFMIRATPANELNDPFELKFSKEQVRQYQEKREIFEDDYDIGETIGVIQSDYEDLGIISLSENYSNPVMWSHYAGEHTGVVVQFEVSEHKSFFVNEFGSDTFGDVYLTPEKVRYNRELPQMSIIDELSDDELEDIKDNRMFFYKIFNKIILLNKSIDWMYEQELIIIVNLKDADRISFNLKIEDELIEDELIEDELILDHIKKQCDRDSQIEFRCENDVQNKNLKKISITYPENFENKYDDVGDESIKQEIYRLTRHLRPIHLFRINQDCIKAIFLGCKFDEGENLKKIKLPKNTKIYRMTMDDNTYLLMPKMFDLNKE